MEVTNTLQLSSWRERLHCEKRATRYVNLGGHMDGFVATREKCIHRHAYHPRREMYEEETELHAMSLPQYMLKTNERRVSVDPRRRSTHYDPAGGLRPIVHHASTSFSQQERPAGKSLRPAWDTGDVDDSQGLSGAKLKHNGDQLAAVSVERKLRESDARIAQFSKGLERLWT
mmetsp:Transcript_30482/g.50494  ORF Transcript_30482/g.50494 Transcript_30482/m.50494 type:complete len:173 (-) Transcript_30482:15-533(-)